MRDKIPVHKRDAEDHYLFAPKAHNIKSSQKSSDRSKTTSQS